MYFLKSAAKVQQIFEIYKSLRKKMDKMAEGGQFGTKDGHIGRDLRLGT
jgi:hypothetical protein